MRNPTWLPSQPLPKYADKVTAAAIVTHLFLSGQSAIAREVAAHGS